MKNKLHFLLLLVSTTSLLAQKIESTSSESQEATKQTLEMGPVTHSDEIILFRSIERPILYSECENKFKIILPKSKKKYTLRSIDSTGEHHISITKDIGLYVYSFSPDKRGNGIGRVGLFENVNLVKEFVFNVKKVPAVEIIEANSGNPLKHLEREGLNVSDTNKTLQLKAISTNEDFGIYCPNDNKYLISKVSVILILGRRQVGNPLITSGGELDLSNFYEKVKNDTAKANYRLIIEITDVNRLNYQRNILNNTKVINNIISIPLYRKEE